MLKDKYRLVWATFFIVALISVTIMITSTFTEPPVKDRSASQEHLILWFYFTFQSNFIGMITSGIITFFKVDREKPWVQRLKICMVINLTITMIVFWTILFRDPSKYSTFTFVSTVLVHAVNPIMALIAFCWDVYKEDYAIKVNVKTTSLLIIYPVVWLIIAVILYYAINDGEHGAIYGFLSFEERPAWLVVLMVFGIGLSYAGFNFAFTKFLMNRSINIFKKAA